MLKNEFEIAVALAKKGAADAVEPLTSGMTYKGAVDYYADLPASPTVGDLYLVRYQGSGGTAQLNARYVWGPVNGTNAWAYVAGGFYFDGDYIVF